jgi:vacuolar-type H+-ATPase subunit I/STV1
MSDNVNWCDPDSLPEDLILSDKELSKMICIIIANVELKRDMIRKYQELLEKLEVERNKQTEGYGSPEALVRTLLQEQLSKNKNNKSADTEEKTFTDKEIEDIRKTLDKIKNAKNKNAKKEKNNNNN